MAIGSKVVHTAINHATKTVSATAMVQFHHYDSHFINITNARNNSPLGPPANFECLGNVPVWRVTCMLGVYYLGNLLLSSEAKIHIGA